MVMMSAFNWPTNADLIFDLAALGFIKCSDRTLDPTFGSGKWWTRFRPDDFTFNDRAIDPDFDFRDMDYQDDEFDLVAFDPPYVAKGGRDTTGILGFDLRYGLVDCPKTPEDLASYINVGITECARVLRPGGTLLIKCKNYVSGGKFFNATYRVERHCDGLGLVTVARLERIGQPGPQPSGRSQKNPRNNLSTLFVYRKPR